MSDEKDDYPEDEPQLFAVKKGNDGGWQFSRRDFIKGAGAVGVVATLGRVSHAQDAEETPTPSPNAGARSHTDNVTTVDFSSDGAFMASGSIDGTVKVWSLPNGDLRYTFEPGYVTSLRFTPAGKYLICATRYAKISVWSLVDGELIYELQSDGNFIHLAVSPDGTQLASCGIGGGVLLWSLLDGTLTRNLKEATTGFDIAFSPDGNLLAVGATSTTYVWSLSDDEEFELKDDYSRRDTDSLAFSPDGQFLFTGHNGATGDFGFIRVWSLAERTQLEHGILSVGYFVDAIAIRPDGNELAYITDGRAVLWSLTNNQVTNQIQNEGSILSIAFSPDGRFLAIGGYAETVQVWSVGDAQVTLYLIDIAASLSDFEGAQYSPNDEGASVITLPCGSDIPAGSTCICNCVAGGGRKCVGYTSGAGGTHYWYPN